MTRFKLAGSWLVALSLLAILGIAPTARTEDRTKEAKAEPQDHHAMMMSCAKACSDCQRECDMCTHHCAGMLAEGKKEHKATLATCQDCASLCSVASQIVARMGPFSVAACAACADACSKCAKECEKQPEDKHMKMCAEECRKCEKACAEMVKHMGGGKKVHD